MKLLPRVLLLLSFRTEMFVKAPGYVPPIYVWPLGQGSGNSEVNHGVAQPNMPIGCDVGINSGPSDLDYSALEFPGSTDSYVDLSIPDTTPLNTDTAFMFYLYMNSTDHGTLLHYKRDSTDSEPTVDELKIHLDNGDVYVELVANAADDSSVSDNSFIENLGPLISADMWYNIAIDYDQSNGNMDFFVDGIKIDLSNGGPPGGKFGLPATIRIGASQSSASDMLTGRITCFLIIPDRYKYDELPSNQGKCLTSAWVVQPASSFCSSSCSALSGDSYGLYSREQIPSEPFTHSLNASSVLHCAEICSRTSSCLSFFVDKITGQCLFYNSNVGQSLTASGSNARYYVKRSPCCV